MYSLYAFEGDKLQRITPELAAQDPSRIVWIDLFEPTQQEETQIEKLFSIDIPTADEMREIELSNRLYHENGALYTTFTIITKADTALPDIASVTLVLVGNTMISVRYSDPQPFRMLQERLQKTGVCTGATVLAGLMEAIINRMADILENIGHQMDGMTQSLFRVRNDGQKADFEEALRHVALNGDAISKARESLVSINRMIGFLMHAAPFAAGKPEHDRVRTLLHDIAALSDHANFLSGKVNFLLDATLGMINIEQNAIIKIVSVGTVVFLPPTLVASVYGMNFKIIPELQWDYGYPMALCIMVLSAFLPYKFFKSKGWL